MNTIQHRLPLRIAVLVALVMVATTAFADPLPGRDLLKFSQQPMDATPID